jgi:hypothetical protein
MRMFTEMTLVCYKSSELDTTIVTPISSNPEYCLEQPVDSSSAVSPGDVVASASRTYMMFRDPLHPESPTGRAWGHTSIGQVIGNADLSLNIVGSIVPKVGVSPQFPG